MKSDWLICVSIYRIQPILSPFRDQPMEWLIACVIYLHISHHPVYYVLWLVTCHNQWDHCFKNLSKRRVPNCLIMHLCRRYLLVYSITCTCILKLRLLAHLTWKLKWTFLIACCSLFVHLWTFHISFSQEPHHSASFNQIWHRAFLGERDSSLFKWKTKPFFKGR